MKPFIKKPTELVIIGSMQVPGTDSNTHVLASCPKKGKRKLTKPSNDSDDDSAGMEYIQDMLDNF